MKLDLHLPEVDCETASTAKLTERRSREYFGDILCLAVFPRAINLTL